jgi:hypothetical protein
MRFVSITAYAFDMVCLSYKRCFCDNRFQVQFQEQIEASEVYKVARRENILSVNLNVLPSCLNFEMEQCVLLILLLISIVSNRLYENFMWTSKGNLNSGLSFYFLPKRQRNSFFTID